MNVSKERLRIIGKMIGVYREENRANTQNCWTQKRFCQDICSPNTLKSVENGGLARSNEVYEGLLKKLNLSLAEFPAIDEALIVLTKKLYIALDYYRINEALDILNKLLRILDKVSYYIYYSEIKSLFQAVKKYYDEETLIETKDVERFKQMMHILPEIYGDIYRFLIYATIKAESIDNMAVYEASVNSIELEACKANFVKIGLLDYFYISDKYIKMKELINKLESAYELNNNIIRLVDIYESAIILLSRIEYDKCLEYIEKSKKLISTEEIPNIKIGELYSNIARAYHINNNYSLALEYYSKMCTFERQIYLNSFIFMADCQNHMKMEIDIPKISEELYNQSPIALRLMYKYFTFGTEYPDFAKERFIVKKIAPSLKDEEYIKVFRFELLRLVNITNHYKAIHTFESKVKENLGN